ncbi:hypothetical protein MHYP_G00113880 [Metynnis hypsauchen]
MRFPVFPYYSAKVARDRAAFSEARKLLRDVEGVRYSLSFPTRLWITYNGTQHLFTSPVEAKGFISSLAKSPAIVLKVSSPPTLAAEKSGWTWHLFKDRLRTGDENSPSK